MTPNDVIASACRMAQVLVRRMTADLSPAEFHHQPVPGTNSAAWVVGHLASVCRRVAIQFGATGLPEIPADLADRLKTTKQPAGAQDIPGDPAELLRLFDAAAEAAAAAVGRLTAEQLAGPSPYKLALTDAVTLADGLVAVIGLHTALHAGQLSTIRRSLGKPPVA
ncbi:MAG: hypothetical protein C0501_07515 [Isosphaera sp.]|nr:hypothetical protein [Isosphaera sp.]